MNRRKAREHALQMLFQYDFTGKSSSIKSLKRSDINAKKNETISKFAGELIKGTISNLPEIDSVIQKAAEHWNVVRMAAVDRNILRFAVYEILYRKDIPSAVTINEALEISKKYSSLESASFINGLLDKIARDAGK